MVMDVGGSGEFDVMEAVRRSWTTLWEHAAVLIGATILGAIVMCLVNLPGSILNDDVADVIPALSNVRDTLGALGLVIEIVFWVLGWITQTFFLLGMGKLYLRASRGQSVDLIDMIVTPRQFLVGLGASLLYTVAILLGVLACLFPSLIVVVLLYYWNFVVVDQEVGSLGVLKESVRLVMFLPGPAVMLFVVSTGLVLLGLMACCVGILVAAPVVGLCWAQLYDHVLAKAPVVAGPQGL